MLKYKYENSHYMKITEQDSKYRHLEKMSIMQILSSINQEDRTVPKAVELVIPQIESLVNAVVEKLKEGGRLFYIGAGTSGRLGIVDASECPPTFGVSHDLVIGLMAGGDSAIRKAVEFAEDDMDQAYLDLNNFMIGKDDVVIGIAASGQTPYVIGGLRDCQKNKITTGCIVCNSDSGVEKYADFPVVCQVGPEFLTGSTRMKAGTAQKLILNMISTATMIQLGKVVDNKMVDMQLSNHKLVKRGVRMIVEKAGIGQEEAKKLLLKHGSVRKALEEIG